MEYSPVAGNINYRTAVAIVTDQQFLEHDIDVTKAVRIKEYIQYIHRIQELIVFCYGIDI